MATSGDGSPTSKDVVPSAIEEIEQDVPDGIFKRFVKPFKYLYD